MFTKGHTVVLESIKGSWMVHFDEPTGKRVQWEFKKDKEGRFVCEIPTEIWYKDQFGTEHKQHENYAQHLLDSYNKKDQYGEIVDEHLRVVQINKPNVVETPVIKEAPISKRAKKGEKKDEEVSVS